MFGNVAEEFLARPLTDPFWMERLIRFFNAGPTLPFREGTRRFERFTAHDVATFAHPKEIYREYDAVDEGNKNNLGTLRLWDFGKCETYFQTLDGRLEIAGREQQVYHWLRDRSEEAEQNLLTPKIDDPDRSVHYWEIYDRRRRLQRLAIFAETEARKLLPSERIELARQLLAALASLHRHDAAHLDLGDHSIWIEPPTTVKFSHLLAARFPEVKSLGTTRYQFLASVAIPDDILGVHKGPKCRDVFLAGVAIHRLFFGRIPEGSPPEWDPAIDSKGEFELLHHWLAQALEMDADRRFPDASVALAAFNKATVAHPTPEEVIAGLERFRGALRSQRQLVSAYPIAGVPIAENDRIDIWRSGEAEPSFIVKLWKQASWGDLKREGTTILAFLERAADIKFDRPSGLATVREVLWLGDAFATVQDWVPGETLCQLLKSPRNDLCSPAGALFLIKRLIETIDGLHERGFGHGDLKPANIVITADGDPILIDAIDFSPRSDGELISSAYAPESGTVFERDRYALTKIAEELFALPEFDAPDSARLAKAIIHCREKEPRLSTLLPLLDEAETILERLKSPAVVDADALPREINICILGAPTGPIAPDEGFLFLHIHRDAESGARSLIIRGAIENIDVRLDKKGQMVFARRRTLQQRLIKIFAAQEFHRIAAVINVIRGDINDLSGLLPVLSDPVVKQRLDDELAGSLRSVSVDPEDPGLPRLSEEEAEENS